MDSVTNGTTGYGGVGFIVLILVFWFFSKNNETPNGYCQDISNQCASGIEVQTTLNNSIRTQKEFCEVTTEVFKENEKTRDKLDEFRDEYQRDQLMTARMALQTEMLKNQTNAQFCATNASIAKIECECLKRPPFYPYGCTPCPVTPCA